MSLAAICAAIAVGSAVAWLAGVALRSWLRRFRRLHRQILAVMLASLTIGASVAVVLARLMVLDEEALGAVMAVLAVTAVVASVLVTTATAPLGDDIGRLEAAVRAIESGDRHTHTRLGRADELGHVAAALDDAVARLGELEDERSADDARRVALFSSISHDLRTPLAALRAALEASEDGLAEDLDRYLGSMQRDVDALTALVDDLFLLARIESGDLAMVTGRVDLAELADDAVEALAPVAAAHGVALRADTGRPAIVVGNTTALGRIIRNLVDNAIRHSPAGAAVEIEVTDGDHPRVRVRDHGDGFPPDFTGVAFDRFTRADTSRSRTTGGAGLGLAIAHGLVHAHGGSIWIDDVDGGAAVSFAVPAGASTPTHSS